jgi:hypothetical protein
MTTLRATAEASATMLASLALGHALEALAASQKFGLHRVPLGPGGGVDPMAATSRPTPFGEHGWLPVPAGASAVAWLLWDGAATWLTPGSFYANCLGPVWGQIPSLVSCCFGTMPTILAAWLLWMPAACTPLPFVLATLAAAASCVSLLFWLEYLPLLPKARATNASRHAGVRRALLALHHIAYYVGFVSDGSCGSAGASFAAEPTQFFEELSREMTAQTPQGAMPSYSLILQVVVACFSIHTIMDRPRPTADGELWGRGD